MQPILQINLDSGNYNSLNIPNEWEEQYIGGASLGARLLYDRLSKNLDAFAPQSPLLFITGPLTGTAGPAVGRFVVCGRSPQTGLWGESNCGGFWGVELRKAGYDGLQIEGRAQSPVFLWIHDGLVEIRNAENLWGLDTYQTQTAVQENIAPEGIGASVAVIGPAGENRIKFALILTDHGRVAGRTGMGAVMGSKNLKAIAVRGRAKVPVAQPLAFKDQRSQINRTLKVDATSAVARELGTAGVAEYFDYLGMMPKKYFQRANFQGTEKISGTQISGSILSGISACHACVIACGRVVKLPGSTAAGQPQKGPEYETLVGFGPNLLIDDLEFITRINDLCDRLGVDTISMSNTIGLAFRLFERGLITPEHTGGMDLNWGDSKNIAALIHQTVRRQGLGAWMADGALALARHFDVPEEAVQVKGLEAAYHDPRGATGMGLVYATSPVGASHNQSDYYLADIGQVEPSLGLKYYDRHAGLEKAGNVAVHQNWRTVSNALVICIFANVDPLQLTDLVNSASGKHYLLPELLTAGERAWNLKRIINLHFGMKPGDDRLPKAWYRPYDDQHPGIPDAFVPDFEAMLDAYYQARGWDRQSGYPSGQTLARLGLEWVGREGKNMAAPGDEPKTERNA